MGIPKADYESLKSQLQTKNSECSSLNTILSSIKEENRNIQLELTQLNDKFK